MLVGSTMGFGAAHDPFGVEQLEPTIKAGRQWFANWQQERIVSAYQTDRADPLLYNEEGTLRIGSGAASVPAGMTRLVVLSPANLPWWTNVEMTIYARRGAATRKIDYQAFYLSARSGERHKDIVPCEGTSYHATARFDGLCGFKKELWHPGGYTGLRPEPTPKPWDTVPEGKWVGIKFICRNCDRGRHVRLQMYLDTEDKNEWKIAAQFTDSGDWRGEKAGCDRPQNYVITEGRPTVYFRTDFVAVDLKKFSVREISPLP